MSEYVGVVTTIGQTKIAAAIGGTALNLTTIRVGDGNGAPITPIPGMVDLVRRVGAGYAIVSSGRDPVNANHWRVTALIPAADGPFDIRELGVFDAAGDMIAIAKHVLVEKRSPAQGAAVELLTDIVFPVSETAQVTVQIQPAAAISIVQMLRAGFTVVESATVTAPPGAPALGRTHVVPTGATGAWVGLAGYLVQWNGIVWVAANVPIGFHVVDNSKGIDTGARWLERTAGGWAPGLSRFIQKQPGNFAVAGGSPNALTITLDPAFAANADIGPAGLIRIKTGVAVNSAAATLAANGLPALPIRTMRGVDITRNDLPANSIISLIATGSAYQLAGIAYSEVPIIGTPTLWVRPDGNDGNDGSANTAASAFATLAAAAEYAVTRFYIPASGAVIRLGVPGTYVAPGAVNAGGSSITIVGDVANPGAYIIQGSGPVGGGSGLIASINGSIIVSGASVQNTSTINSNVAAAGAGSLQLAATILGTAVAGSPALVNVSGGGKCSLFDNCTMAGSANSMWSVNAGQLVMAGNVIMANSPDFPAGAVAVGSNGSFQRSGAFGFFGAGATGPRFSIALNGSINVSGAGETFLPGSTAGFKATGGEYA